MNKIQNKKAIWGWAIYDWANSAFVTTVVAGFFPIFFANYWSKGTDSTTSTAQLGFANSIAGLCIVILAPILGAIADKGTKRKKFLIFFTYLGIIMTIGLFFIKEGNWLVAIIIYTLGVVGFSGSVTFYDSLLPDVAGTDPKTINKISGLGYGLGYLGGGILLALNVFMVQSPTTFGLVNSSDGVLFSFLTVAIWWSFFSFFTFIFVKEKKYSHSTDNLKESIILGYKQLKQTIIHVKQYRNIMYFLIAYWLYIDGVDTIIRMAVKYGLSLGFESSDLILALLLVQFIGLPATILFAFLSNKIGLKKGIYIAIIAYIIITTGTVFITHKIHFFVIAGCIGLVQGGIQATSRSFYIGIIPKEHSAEFFGFYNMIGKFAVLIGPALMGGVGLLVKYILLPYNATQAQTLVIDHLAARISMGALIILFISGILFFSKVKEKIEHN